MRGFRNPSEKFLPRLVSGNFRNTQMSVRKYAEEGLFSETVKISLICLAEKRFRLRILPEFPEIHIPNQYSVWGDFRKIVAVFPENSGSCGDCRSGRFSRSSSVDLKNHQRYSLSVIPRQAVTAAGINCIYKRPVLLER